MGIEKTGQAIAHLRKKAGMTQRELAERLRISDKAVSKWERGLSMPDISCLETLAELLNTETDSLLSGAGEHNGLDWRGILVLDEKPDRPFSGAIVYDKPLICYLLSNFLLSGIREIYVYCPERDRRFLLEEFEDGEKLGISLHCDIRTGREVLPNGNTMLMFGQTLLYGAGLTKRFQKIMTENGRQVIGLGPLLFFPQKTLKELPSRVLRGSGAMREMLSAGEKLFDKELGRGILEITLDNWDDVADAAAFVRIIQNRSGEKLCCLEEIAWRRGLIGEKQSESGARNR